MLEVQSRRRRKEVVEAGFARVRLNLGVRWFQNYFSALLDVSISTFVLYHSLLAHYRLHKSVEKSNRDLCSILKAVEPERKFKSGLANLYTTPAPPELDASSASTP